MALHEVSILFRAQDHLSKVLGNFANLFTGLEGKVETFQQNLEKIGNLQERLNQKRLQQNAQLVRDQERLAQAEERHQQNISRIQDQELTKRWNLQQEHAKGIAALNEQTERRISDFQKEEYARRDAALAENHLKQISRQKDFAGQMANIESEYNRKIKLENDSAKLSNKNLQTELLSANKNESRLRNISFPEHLAGLTPEGEANRQELVRQFKQTWADADVLVSAAISEGNEELAASVYKQAQKETAPLQRRLRDIEKAAGIENVQNIEYPAAMAATQNLLSEQERLRIEHAASIQALESEKVKKIAEKQSAASKSGEYYGNVANRLYDESEANIAAFRHEEENQFNIERYNRQKTLDEALAQLPEETASKIAMATEANDNYVASLQRVAEAARAAGERQIQVMASEEARRQALLPYQERYEAAQEKLGRGIALFGEGVGMTFLGSMARGWLTGMFEPIIHAGEEKTQAELWLRSNINNKAISPLVQSLIYSQANANPMLTDPELINTFIGLRSALGGHISNVFGQNWQSSPDLTLFHRAAMFKSIMEKSYGLSSNEVDSLFKQVEMTTPSRMGNHVLTESEKNAALLRRLNIITAVEAYATKNRLSPANIESFLNRSVSAGLNFTDQGLLESLMFATMIPGGSAGAALTSFVQQMTQPGVHFHAGPALAMLEKTGLIKASGVEYMKSKATGKLTSQIEEIKSSAISGFGMLSTNPVAWFQKYAIPAIEKAFPQHIGETNQEYQARLATKLAVMLPGMQSSKLAQLFWGQGSRAISETQQAWRSAGVPQAYKELDQSFVGTLAKWHTQTAQLQMALSEGLLPVLTDWMTKLIPVIERLSIWSDKNKSLVEGLANLAIVITGIISVLGPIMIAGGLLKSLFALPGVAKEGGLLGEKAAELGLESLARSADIAAAALNKVAAAGDAEAAAGAGAGAAGAGAGAAGAGAGAVAAGAGAGAAGAGVSAAEALGTAVGAGGTSAGAFATLGPLAGVLYMLTHLPPAPKKADEDFLHSLFSHEHPYVTGPTTLTEGHSGFSINNLNVYVQKAEDSMESAVKAVQRSVQGVGGRTKTARTHTLSSLPFGVSP